MPGRSGRWARQKVWASQLRFVRANPVPIAVLVIFVALMATGIAVFVPRPGNLFVAGVVVGALPFAVLMVAQGWTGAAGTSMGATAEGWTSSELRRFVRRARRRDERWRLVDHIPLAGWDVDHVLIGPGGVFAIESKWSAEGWRSTWAQGRLSDIAKSARLEARKVESILRSEPHRLRLPVTPVVVVWPNTAKPARLAVDGMTEAIYGGDLVDWCLQRPTQALDTQTVESVHTALVDFVRMRERHELKEAGAGPLRRMWYRVWLDPSRLS